jgi:hypothetical protein
MQGLPPQLWSSHGLSQAEPESREATRGMLPRAHLSTNANGDQMGNLELAGTLKTLQGERAETQKKLTKLDKAIAVLRELNGTNSTPSPNGRKRTLSAAARRKIAKAQRARWAKLKEKRAV